MKRTLSVLVAVATVLLASPAAHAGDDPLPGQRLAPRQWPAVPGNPDSLTYRVGAPVGWRFSQLPDGGAAFEEGRWRLLVQGQWHERSARTQAALKADHLADSGKPGLVVERTTHTAVAGERVTTLTFRWRPDGGRARLVLVRWIAHGSVAGARLQVAGGPADRAGLTDLLDRVTPTVQLAG
ncbi:hypothetical protein [Nocardioides sp. SYSU D00038]|uniref:hypothetical protein n=1 Tax=Nocardioides sp. SYSU D00038 TaxID=2812554 RepID=UPI0019680064|nr:hypothetical protein [Nocardioides sp. SYSU D00038]